MTRRALAALVALPLVVGVVAVLAALRHLLRLARGEPASEDPDVPTPEPSVGLAVGLAVDSLVTLPVGLLASTGTTSAYRRSSDELDAAVTLYDALGWLEAPLRRHLPPPPLTDPDLAPGRAAGLETLRFPSGWAPQEDEPGRERWQSFEDNRRVPVTLLRHGDRPRPWLIAVHGQGMGRPSDVRMLGVRRLHHQLGVNVAMPVLPLHGARAAGLTPERQFVSNLYLLNNVLGLSQAVWDLRRLLTWLHEVEEAPAVGVLGVSLGAYVGSLLSTLVDDLACVVAVVPTSDLAESLRAAEPVVTSKRRLHRALHDERSDAVHRLVSPLAGPCLVPRDRRFIVAGQVDQIAPPAGAAALWRHWERPSIEWRARGHVTTFRSEEYDVHIAAVLTAAGLSTRGSRCAS